MVAWTLGVSHARVEAERASPGAALAGRDLQTARRAARRCCPLRDDRRVGARGRLHSSWSHGAYLPAAVPDAGRAGKVTGKKWSTPRTRVAGATLPSARLPAGPKSRSAMPSCSACADLGAATAAILCVLSGDLGVPPHAVHRRAVLEGRGDHDGIASHSLSAIPGLQPRRLAAAVLHDAPRLDQRVRARARRRRTRSRSLFGMLAIPAGTWAALEPVRPPRRPVRRRACSRLSTFLTAYSQETRMYSLMALLGLLATAGFLHAFVYRRRRYLILFAVCAGADALHARLGDVLRRSAPCSRWCRSGALSDGPRGISPRRRAGVRRRRDPVPAVAARTSSTRPPTQARRGRRAPLRRSGPAVARPARRRPRHGGARGGASSASPRCSPSATGAAATER